MSITLHHGDLPAGLDLGGVVAVDTETMGLQPGARPAVRRPAVRRRRRTPISCSWRPGGTPRPTCAGCWPIPARLKLFHFARFDLAVLRRYLGVDCAPVYCTKIASRLARTYTDRHGLKDLVRELLGIELDKAEQSSDWGAASSARRSCATRPAMCSTCTRCGRGST